MTFMRRALVPVLAVATLIAGGLGWTASSASSATAPTFSYTVAGTDAHSLDPRFQPVFVDGGGMQGVLDAAGDNPNTAYLETTLELPVGARVTSIAVTYTSCPSAQVGPYIVFGSYSPSTRNTLQTSTLSAPRSCMPKTVTKTGNPITTTVAGRRHALDFDGHVFEDYPGTGRAAFYGATIKYTCTTPCVP